MEQRISIDCGIDSVTGRDTCNDNEIEKRTHQRESNDERNGEYRGHSQSNKEKAKTLHASRGIEEPSISEISRDMGFFNDSRNGVILFDRNKHNMGMFLVTSGMKPSIAQKVIRGKGWHTVYMHMIDNLERNPATPLTFRNFRTLTICMKNYQESDATFLLDEEQKELYEFAKNANSALEMFFRKQHPAVNYYMNNMDKYFYENKADVEKAKKRFEKMLKGKRLRLNDYDKMIIQKLGEYEQLKQVNEISKNIAKFSKPLNVFGIALDLIELINTFYRSYEEQNWTPFIAKVLSVGISMHTMYLVGLISIAGIPEVIAISVFAVLISSVLSDEKKWNDIIDSIYDTYQDHFK